MGELKTYLLDVRVEVDADGTIRTVMDGAVKGILRTQEEQARNALIALGWTPPPAPDASDWQSIAEDLAKIVAPWVEQYNRDNPMRTANVHKPGCNCARCFLDNTNAILDRFRTAGGKL